MKLRPAVVVGPSARALGAGGFVDVQLHTKTRRTVSVHHKALWSPDQSFKPGDLVRLTCQNLEEDDAKARSYQLWLAHPRSAVTNCGQQASSAASLGIQCSQRALVGLERYLLLLFGLLR